MGAGRAGWMLAKWMQCVGRQAGALPGHIRYFVVMTVVSWIIQVDLLFGSPGIPKQGSDIVELSIVRICHACLYKRFQSTHPQAHEILNLQRPHFKLSFLTRQLDVACLLLLLLLRCFWFCFSLRSLAFLLALL